MAIKDINKVKSNSTHNMFWKILQICGNSGSIIKNETFAELNLFYIWYTISFYAIFQNVNRISIWFTWQPIPLPQACAHSIIFNAILISVLISSLME
jgi:hypothetical protein